MGSQSYFIVSLLNQVALIANATVHIINMVSEKKCPQNSLLRSAFLVDSNQNWYSKRLFLLHLRSSPYENSEEQLFGAWEASLSIPMCFFRKTKHKIEGIKYNNDNVVSPNTTSSLCQTTAEFKVFIDFSSSRQDQKESKCAGFFKSPEDIFKIHRPWMN